MAEANQRKVAMGFADSRHAAIMRARNASRRAAPTAPAAPASAPASAAAAAALPVKPTGNPTQKCRQAMDAPPKECAGLTALDALSRPHEEKSFVGKRVLRYYNMKPTWGTCDCSLSMACGGAPPSHN